MTTSAGLGTAVVSGVEPWIVAAAVAVFWRYATRWLDARWFDQGRVLGG